MADIAMCKAKCKIKKYCYRATAIENEYRQSYFMDKPIHLANGDCTRYEYNDIAQAVLRKEASKDG